MNIALDTNIIVYSLVGAAQTAEAASRALEEAANRGGILVISAPVYAELLAIPESTKGDLDGYIAETGIRVDWEISPSSWTVAGLAFAAYARRRKRSKIEAPRRILADFIIGAHSLVVGHLLTADPSFYRTNFPELDVLAFE
jgi:predicted nucleic acid-binding protein